MNTSRNIEFRDAAQGVWRTVTEAYHWIDEGANTTQRGDAPRKWIYRGVHVY